LATSVVGGVLALAKIIANPQRALAIFHLRGNAGFGDGIPYGVAIAVSGAAVAVGAICGL
jgi:Flp pilus assembly protein protease CpaA